MEQTVLKASRRTRPGTRHARRERKAGRLPAVIYGHGEAPEPISLDTHDALVGLQHGARLISLEVDGKRTPCLVKDVQYDYLGTHPIHLDLIRVDLTERVPVRVAVELRGTPAGIAEGGVLDHPTTEIEVECLVTEIPDTIPVGIRHLGVGDVLLAKDLELPPGVTLLSEPGERIAAVRLLAAEVPTEEAAAAEAAQPEVIGRAKPEEESQETA